MHKYTKIALTGLLAGAMYLVGGQNAYASTTTPFDTAHTQATQQLNDSGKRDAIVEALRTRDLNEYLRLSDGTRFGENVLRLFPIPRVYGVEQKISDILDGFGSYDNLTGNDNIRLGSYGEINGKAYISFQIRKYDGSITANNMNTEITLPTVAAGTPAPAQDTPQGGLVLPPAHTPEAGEPGAAAGRGNSLLAQRVQQLREQRGREQTGRTAEAPAAPQQPNRTYDATGFNEVLSNLEDNANYEEPKQGDSKPWITYWTAGQVLTPTDQQKIMGKLHEQGIRKLGGIQAPTFQFYQSVANDRTLFPNYRIEAYPVGRDTLDSLIAKGWITRTSDTIFKKARTDGMNYFPDGKNEGDILPYVLVKVSNDGGSVTNDKGVTADHFWRIVDQRLFEQVLGDNNPVVQNLRSRPTTAPIRTTRVRDFIQAYGNVRKDFAEGRDTEDGTYNQFFDTVEAPRVEMTQETVLELAGAQQSARVPTVISGMHAADATLRNGYRKSKNLTPGVTTFDHALETMVLLDQENLRSGSPPSTGDKTPPAQPPKTPGTFTLEQLFVDKDENRRIEGGEINRNNYTTLGINLHRILARSLHCDTRNGFIVDTNGKARNGKRNAIEVLYENISSLTSDQTGRDGRKTVDDAVFAILTPDVVSGQGYNYSTPAINTDEFNTITSAFQAIGYNDGLTETNVNKVASRMNESFGTYGLRSTGRFLNARLNPIEIGKGVVSGWEYAFESRRSDGTKKSLGQKILGFLNATARTYTVVNPVLREFGKEITLLDKVPRGLINIGHIDKSARRIVNMFGKNKDFRIGTFLAESGNIYRVTDYEDVNEGGSGESSGGDQDVTPAGR